MTWLDVSIGISELVAFYLIWRLWQSAEILFFKICYTIIALIPFFGPLFVVWVANMPSRQSKVLQDQHYRQSDVFDHWRHVLQEKNPQRKFKLWKDMVGKEADCDDKT